MTRALVFDIASHENKDYVRLAVAWTITFIPVRHLMRKIVSCDGSL